MIVTLSEFDLMLGRAIARKWNNDAKDRKAPPRYGAAPDDYSLDELGVLGELAVSKYLNMWPSGLGEFGAHDVGWCVEVRSIQNTSHSLIIHPKDRNDAPFVLACRISDDTFDLIGWLYGTECKQDRYWRDPKGGRPAYFVPQSRLRSMNELREVLYREAVAKQEAHDGRQDDGLLHLPKPRS